MKKVIISGLIVTILGGITVELVKNKYFSSESTKKIKQENNEGFPVPTPEALAYEVLESLRNSDPVRFQNVVPTNKDFESLINFVNEDKKSEFIFKTKEFKDEFGDPGTFMGLYKKGKELKIDWNRIDNIKIKSKISKDEIYNLTYSDNIFIDFSYEGNSYQIKINDALKAARGWVLYDYMSLYKVNLKE